MAHLIEAFMVDHCMALGWRVFEVGKEDTMMRALANATLLPFG